MYNFLYCRYHSVAASSEEFIFDIIVDPIQAALYRIFFIGIICYKENLGHM